MINFNREVGEGWTIQDFIMDWRRNNEPTI